MRKVPCDVCKTINENRGTIPDCIECSPIVCIENEEAFNIFPRIYNQLLFAGMGEPVGLNMIAVKAVFDMLEVKDQKTCLEKTMQMFDYYFEKVKEK